MTDDRDLELIGPTLADLLIARAGRRVAAATVALSTSERRDLEVILELEQATHDLILAAGYPCPYCTDGDCAGTLGAAPRQVDDVDVDERRL